LSPYPNLLIQRGNKANVQGKKPTDYNLNSFGTIETHAMFEC